MNKKIKQQLQTEVDASFLYKILSEKVGNPSMANIYLKMSEIEGRHATRVLAKIPPGEADQKDLKPSLEARLQAKLADMFGYEFILSNLIATEEKMALAAIEHKTKAGEKISGSETYHVEILHELSKKKGGMSGSQLAKFEGRHKSVGGNALRAAVLGANDGLVSNLSLIMGVAGALSGRREIIIAGLAGLLAGAIAMALGEWLSVQSSRELHQRQIDIESEELENSPEEEVIELSLIYQAKGIEPDKAEEMARKVLENKETALDTLVREELNIDVSELGGSAWEAAFASFALFTTGAIIPLLPFLVSSESSAVWKSLIVSAVGLFLIGAATTLFTGTKIFFSGIRQVIFGLAAAAVTFGIGKIIGISISG